MRTQYRFCKDCNQLHDAAEWPHAPEVIEAKYDPSANYDEYLRGPKAGTFARCKLCGDLHDIYDWPDNHREPDYDLRSELGAPFLISDNLESIGGLNGLQSMADGRWYTSKAKMRAEYRARGVIEVGNDAQRLKPMTAPKPKPDRRKIKESIQRAMSAVDNEGATAANYRARTKTKSVFGTVAK